MQRLQCKTCLIADIPEETYDDDKQVLNVQWQLYHSYHDENMLMLYMIYIYIFLQCDRIWMKGFKIWEMFH